MLPFVVVFYYRGWGAGEFTCVGSVLYFLADMNMHSSRDGDPDAVHGGMRAHILGLDHADVANVLVGRRQCVGVRHHHVGGSVVALLLVGSCRGRQARWRPTVQASEPICTDYCPG
jgi:hypothetical protein